MTKQPNEDKQSKNSETLRALANFSHIGITMAASVVVGVMIGKYLDEFFGTAPWLLLVFSLLGIGASFKYIYDISKDKK